MLRRSDFKLMPSRTFPSGGHPTSQALERPYARYRKFRRCADDSAFVELLDAHLSHHRKPIGRLAFPLYDRDPVQVVNGVLQ